MPRNYYHKSGWRFRFCFGCGGTFRSRRSDAAYCSVRCRVKTHRELKVVRAIIAQDVEKRTAQNQQG